MKKILLISLLGLLATGCAQIETSIKRQFTSSINLAKQDCTEMGFRPGTPQYLQCVNTVTNNIRTQRAIASAELNAWQPSQSYGPKTVTCHQTGYHTVCNGF